MDDRLQQFGDIIVAIVKANGGLIELSHEQLAKEPHDAVFITPTEYGVELKYKNQTVL